MIATSTESIKASAKCRIHWNPTLTKKKLKNQITRKIYLHKLFDSFNIHGIANWNDNSTRMGIYKIYNIKSGKLSAPIFGVDGHDILSAGNHQTLNLDDPRIIFTKSFRLIDNNVNLMRGKDHQFQSKVDKLVFFGHSLGRADYSYFETLFDLYDIYNSNVELDFYYHTHNESLKDRESERTVLRHIVNLLTSYGQTLSDQHGENIVNRLVLEQRLNLLPSPEM